MKTIEQLKGLQSQCIDGRDMYRLAQFLTLSEAKEIGLEVEDGVTEEKWMEGYKPYTRENILEQLRRDVEFGFEKALDKRGISSSLMFNCVMLWNWILEEGLEDWDEDNYAMYGLPLFKATAVKYGWDNPIGDDSGSEDYYNEEEY